ncbi:class IV lanthionine synthetase LanL [Streptomyces sp. NPDC053431]|uniref:class IV lanthionine synthetase LanL n=1 Tax=Streptomyces sp. NPDC053431 TaxID=3365703 RepID=UPI0037D738AA
MRDKIDSSGERGASILVDLAASTLKRHGLEHWSIQPESFWCYVTPPPGPGPRRTQGWKIHVSATPLSSPLVLAKAGDVLVRHKVSYKFAKDLSRVTEITSRNCDRSGGGKFITAYPDCSEDELRALVEELHVATRGVPGPAIMSDLPYRPGSLVHYRFGTFSGVRMLSNDGSYEAMLVRPDGSLALDQREAWFTPPAWAPPDPFRMDALPEERQESQRVLLNSRYLVQSAISHAFTGGVYRGTDTIANRTVVIKQSRPHTGADVTGHDIRDTRRHEAEMLRIFSGSERTPEFVDLFEQQGDLFLVEQEIPGETLRHWVQKNASLLRDSTGTDLSQSPAYAVALQLVDLVEYAHAAGVVIRDLNPNNLMVTTHDKLYLIDLEALATPGDLVSRIFTPGYGSPEQVKAPWIGPAPRLSSDLFSLGATLFYLFTGADPVLPPDEPTLRTFHDRITAWFTRIASPAVASLAPLIASLMSQDTERPGPGVVRDALKAAATPSLTVAATTESRLDASILARYVEDATGYLIDSMNPSGDRLWQSSEFGASTDPCNVQHGAAGVLSVLMRVYAMKPEGSLRDAVATVAAWITSHASREPRALPGLYFGRSGTAWSLLDAGELLGDPRLTKTAVQQALSIPLRFPNPDVCHGMAGAGLAQLHFWQRTGDEIFLERSRAVADALSEAAVLDADCVSWPIPRTFDSALAGITHYGFAHGTAGVGTFLLAIGMATGEQKYLQLAARAAETLIDAAKIDRGAAFWPRSEEGGALLTNWCSGSSGVGTFLARMWQVTGETRFHDIADQAAQAVYRSRWQAGTVQCHGLAGDGEFLLDLAEISGNDHYRTWACELAESIYARHALHGGRMLPPDETRTSLHADYNTGISGILGFLLRLQKPAYPRLWLPENLSPAARQNPTSFAFASCSGT